MKVGRENKKGGKTWLTSEERLKRIEMMTRKIMRELMKELMMISIIIIGYLFKLANVCRWSKIILFKACMKEGLV